MFVLQFCNLLNCLRIFKVVSAVVEVVSCCFSAVSRLFPVSKFEVALFVFPQFCDVCLMLCMFLWFEGRFMCRQLLSRLVHHFLC